MDQRDQAKNELDTHYPDFLQQYMNINVRKVFRCTNPAHEDRHPSMCYIAKSHRTYCPACRTTHDICDDIGIVFGLTSYNEQLKKGCELYHIDLDGHTDHHRAQEGAKMSKQQEKAEQPRENKTSYYRQCNSRITETDYPQKRGLSLKTLNAHMIGYDPALATYDADEDGKWLRNTTWKAMIIPTTEFDYNVRNTDPAALKKNRFRKGKGTEAGIFSYKTLQTATQPIFVVEGEIDAMSIEEAGGAAIGLASTSGAKLLVKRAKEKKPVQPLILALDKDDSGQSTEKQLSEDLTSIGVPNYRRSIYGECKDANDALLKDREAFRKIIADTVHEVQEAEQERISEEDAEKKAAEEKERQEYFNNSAGNNLQQFLNGIKDSADTPCIPTGFSLLDSALDGGLYEGLYIMGAITSSGKTSIVLQMTDNIAKAGNDVLIFSLEMARSELMSKSISRHTAEIAIKDNIDTSNAKTARGITDGRRYQNYNSTERDLILRATKAYSEYANRIFIQEGIGDIGIEQIRKTVEKHIRITGNKPLVVVDYLQILAPYNVRATDKQNTDKAVLELKRISRDFKIPVIAISSFNRNGYNVGTNLQQFKESGAIEYSCDVAFGLQLKGTGAEGFNATAQKQKAIREMELVVLKNRQGGVGAKIQFNYYPPFNIFIETGIEESK